MSHVVNPHLFRLNYTVFWNVNNFSKKKFSLYFDLNSILIYKFLYHYFRRINFTKKMYAYILKIKLVYVLNTIKIFLFFKKYRHLILKNFQLKKNKLNKLKILKSLIFKIGKKKVVFKKLNKNKVLIKNKKEISNEKNLKFKKSEIFLNDMKFKLLFKHDSFLKFKKLKYFFSYKKKILADKIFFFKIGGLKKKSKILLSKLKGAYIKKKYNYVCINKNHSKLKYFYFNKKVKSKIKLKKKNFINKIKKLNYNTINNKRRNFIFTKNIKTYNEHYKVRNKIVFIKNLHFNNKNLIKKKKEISYKLSKIKLKNKKNLINFFKIKKFFLRKKKVRFIKWAVAFKIARKKNKLIFLVNKKHKKLKKNIKNVFLKRFAKFKFIKKFFFNIKNYNISLPKKSFLRSKKPFKKLIFIKSKIKNRKIKRLLIKRQVFAKYKKKKSIKNFFSLKKLIFDFKILKNKLLFFKFFAKIIILKKKFLKIFKRLFSHKLNFNLLILIKRSFKDSFNADAISDLIIYKLKQKSQIRGVMIPLLRLLRKKCLQRKLRGYAILLTGRFTRKDRAVYDWKKMGKTSRNNRMDLIDYSNKRVALKYSSVAFKISLIKSVKRSDVKE